MRKALVSSFVLFAALLGVAPGLSGAEPPGDEEILALAARGVERREFHQAIEARFSAEQLTGGDAHVSKGPDFLFVFRSDAEPELEIDDAPAGRLTQAGHGLWVLRTGLRTGSSHAIQYFVDGKPAGRRVDVRTYSPLHYSQAGVPEGKLYGKFVHTSKIYPGMQSDFWFYVSPGCKAATPCPVMVWQDGQGFASRTSPSRLFTVTENLVAQKRIPPMVHVLIAPGTVGERRMRSIQYDTVNDTYTRFVLEEIFPEVEKQQKLRKDGYSRGIAGQSSGGICAFNAAWQKPGEFARVLSRIGSYTSIQWIRDQPNASQNLDGGNIFPFLVRKSDRKNIRVWMEDGSNDLENAHGSWPLQNVQLANSLKMKEYDFRFLWGNAQHNTTHGDSLLPEALEWLWRGYDANRTSEEFTMDPAEKDKPYFRIRALNRTE